MVERIQNILKAEFPGMELDLETMSSGNITGDAVWAGFDDLDQVDRQILIRAALRRALGTEATLVTILLTFTPAEVQSMMAA
jgi:acid stress-induced BolA-like protein IbaG/YrbA